MIESPLDINDLPTKVKIDHLITEDDAPVDNLFSEKQQRLLTEPLYTSWQGPGEDRPFLAMANVGVFMMNENPAIVPDMLLSLDVVMPEDWWSKEGRSYMVWEVGKMPDLVVEIVSNKKGNELGEKMKRYEYLRVPIYLVMDPTSQIQEEYLAIYLLNGFGYRKANDVTLFPEIGLGITLWEGEFEGRTAKWLRWTDLDGNLIPIAAEQKTRADQEQARAEQERARADQEQARAEQERARAERLEAQLRAAGMEPE